MADCMIRPIHSLNTTTMKPRLLIFLVIIQFVHTGCKQSSDPINLQNEEEARHALAHTWETEYMETGSIRNKVPENMVAHFILNKNGTYISGVKNGVIKEEGRWSYDAKTKMLNISSVNGNSSSRILKLTGKELISSSYMTMDGEIIDSTIVTYKKL